MPNDICCGERVINSVVDAIAPLTLIDASCSVSNTDSVFATITESLAIDAINDLSVALAVLAKILDCEKIDAGFDITDTNSGLELTSTVSLISECCTDKLIFSGSAFISLSNDIDAEY